ncbi:MAG: dimethylsulfoniopropionate demethylase [Geminicoccaceae bacterium]
MPSTLFFPSSRVRRTPFSRRVDEAGAKAYSVYNHMLIPTCFRSVEEDYAHLKSAVQLWDVACERQVEIVGPDALRLIQMATPRDLAPMKDDQCYYIPMVDEDGRLLNDPVLIKLSADRYWVSIADSDVLFYFKGLANGFGLDVRVFEPDLSPLGIQGPKTDELVRRVFGEDIAAIRFFRHSTISVQGKAMIIARSGFSHQGGFEIYVDGTEHGEPLWDRLMEAGEDLNIRAGGPNGIERIEAGLLSYGGDITREHTPFEAGLGNYCHLDRATSCLGRGALMAKREPSRQIRPVEIAGDAIPPLGHPWPLKDEGGNPTGRISAAACSPDFRTNVAIAMVDRAHWEPGTELVVEAPDGPRAVCVRQKFWI